MSISIYAIFDKHQVYEDAKIGSDIEALKPKDNDITFTLDELAKINNDINGWVRINNTAIDYPIVQSTNNTKYLTNNFKNEDTGSGSIFLDYRNDINFSDDYNIIYGHNLQSELMFGDVLNYKSKKYFNTHRKGRLYTLNAQYKIEIFSYSIIDSSKINIYNLDNLKTNKNSYIIDVFKQNAINYKDIGIKDTDKLLVLSTCDDGGTYKRSVLLARIVKEVDVLTTTITTKESKIATEPVQDDIQAYVAPKPPKQTPKNKSLPKISAYNIILFLGIIFVIGIYIILIKEKIKVKNRNTTRPINNQYVQIEEPQILQTYEVNDFFAKAKPEICQTFDYRDDIV